MENTEQSSASAPSSSAAGGKEKIEKQARQLAYDTRYKVKQAMAAKAGSKLDPVAVRKAYAAQLAKSPASPPVKARAKEMLLGEDLININDLVIDNASAAIHKVFSEHHEKDADGNVIPHEEEVIEEGTKEKTYRIRVTDKKTNNSYVRNATRDQIRELRANPNISSVEMTGYGEPTKSEKYKGKQTAAVKSGKDPETASEEVSIKKSIKSENFDGFLELIEKKKTKKEDKTVTGEGVDNSKLIKVFPDETVKEQSLIGTEKREDPKPIGDAQKKVDTKQKMIAQQKRRILLTKMQAISRGAGTDIQASHHPEGETIEEADSLSAQVGRWEAARQKRMKQRQSYERPHWIPRDQDHSDRWGSSKGEKKKPQKTHANLQNEEGEYGDNQEAPAPGTVCFDGGAALPTTIKPIGDPRELPTAVNLIKTKLRAQGLNMSHELEGDVIEEGEVNRADIIGGTKAAKNAQKGIGKYTPGKGVTKNFQLDPNFVKDSFDSEKDMITSILESEKVAAGADKRAKELAQKRRNKGYKEQGYNAYRPGKNERAAYNLASSARSADSSPETQRTKKKKPAGADTSQIGHYAKRDAKETVGKRGKPLKKPRYKLSLGQRVDHHSNKAYNRRDPKQNPKHEANK